MYRESPSTLEMKPPDGPYSGCLVITDEEADAQDTLCWASCGLCKRKKVKKLPFPQDKILTIVYTSDQYHDTRTTNVWFIPVPDQPLSSNCYYVIRAKGRHKGYDIVSWIPISLSTGLFFAVVFKLKVYSLVELIGL